MVVEWGVTENEHVILVDDADTAIGVGEKLDVHRRGDQHRAFSVFIFDSAGEVLLHRRAAGKYHSGGLWTNACCGHPRPGEETLAAAERRLVEEMGIRCELREVGVFSYRAELDSGLIENEIDHVFVGRFDGDPQPDPAEISEWARVGLREVRARLAGAPNQFTVWFLPAFELVDTGRTHKREEGC